MGLNLSEKTCLGYVVILRVYIGSYLLYQGIRKYLRDFPHSGWIERQIGKLNEVELFSIRISCRTLLHPTRSCLVIWSCMVKFSSASVSSSVS